jgi:hypothetical protein
MEAVKIFRANMIECNSIPSVVVAPDWCIETALGSSLFPVKGQFILSLSMYQYDLLKIVIYFYFFSSFQAIAPLMGQKRGPFLRGHISLKNAPFLATIQALSKTCTFLLGKKKRRLLCMGRTSTPNKPLSLY